MDPNARVPLHTLRTAVQDLFNLYLGGPRSIKNDDAGRDFLTSNVRKRVTAMGKSRSPKDDQFAVDLMQLQNQFPDQEQLRTVAESILASLLANCGGHMVQADFLLFALHTLLRLNLLSWDTFLPLLLRAALTAESSCAQSGHLQSATVSSAVSVSVPASFTSTMALPQVSTPAPASPTSAIIGSPAYSAIDPTVNQSPVKGPDPSSSVTGPLNKGVGSSQGHKVAAWLRQLVCKVILSAVESTLRPVTCLDVLSQMVQWIHTCDAMELNVGEEGKLSKAKRLEMGSTAWLYSCLEVIRTMLDEKKCRLPFYVLLHDRTQLQVDRWPNDEVLFAFFLEIHRRRDKVALYMQMLDQHLHCPTFATQRMIALTYQGVMGEPLHGEDVATSLERGSIDWERALRCLRHSLRVIPSTDWWRRVLITAPRFSQQSTPVRQGYFVSSLPNFVFTAEMTCEAVIDRILELMQPATTEAIGITSSTISDGEAVRWEEWVSFADLFFFLVRTCYVDILEFIDMLATRFAKGEHQMVHSNHVTWLLAQVFRLDTVTEVINSDPRKVETTQKILSFHKEEHSTEQNGSQSSQSMLLDLVGSSQILRLWSMNRAMMEQLAGKHVPEHLQKGRLIDEWWKKVGKGEQALDFSNLDDNSKGMIWVLSLIISQPVCEAVMTWMKSNGFAEVLVSGNMGQGGDRLVVVNETQPLPMTLLSGLSLHLCTRLISQLEDLIFGGQMLPSIAMMETYARLLLIAPQTLFKYHLTGMMQKYQQMIGKSGVSISILELLNYRLIPLYRYHGKVKQLLYDVAKIIITMKGKRGEHRLFCLAENLCLNLIFSLREVMLFKRELKGATTEFSETLNRAMVINLAFTIKTRGIAEFEQQVLLPAAIDQILANSPHSWSEKTLRHFPPLLRDLVGARPGKRSQTIQGWQQTEPTMLHQCRQLLSPTLDPSQLINYVNRPFPHQHRQYICAAAWILMDKQPESINIGNLGRVLKELTPEEVTANVYAMVDVLLFHTQLHIQHGHAAQEILYRASTTLSLLVWTQELLPFDIVLLALADRDDDPFALRFVIWLLLDTQEFHQRVQNYCVARGQQEHWCNPGPFQRADSQQALGVYLTGKDRFPVYFDDMCARALPVIQLVIYRFIENDALETAERLLDEYSTLLAYHPFRFTFVRDTLAYFYGTLSSKFVIKLLLSLDLTKIPFSDAFLRDMPSSNSGHLFVSDYFSNLLVNLVNLVLPPLNSKVSSMIMEASGGSRAGGSKFQASVVPTAASSVPEIPKVFYQHKDPGTYPQLVLETVVIELLSLPHTPKQIVSTLVHIAVRVQPYAQSHPPLHGQTQPHSLAPSTGSSGHLQNVSCSNPRSPLVPTSPTATNVDPLSSSVNSATTLPGSSTVIAGHNVAVSSPLMIQACGLLLAQLPTLFHQALYTEAAQIFKECWWMTNANNGVLELDVAYGYSAWDPTWAVEDDTSNVLGNTIALLHAFASNLPFEWLEGIHSVITLQRPIVSVAQLRLAFRIIGPLLPRLVISKPVFTTTLALLFTILADVFGHQAHLSTSIDACEISDLVDFLHHAVMLEVQGSSGKPRPETLLLCSKGVDRLRADIQPLFRHLSLDTNVSVYAATHPKLVQRPPSPLLGIM